MASIKTYSVTVHPFTSPTFHSCAYERGDPTSRNALLYIGGLTSGPHTTPALDSVFEALCIAHLSYSLWEFRMRSSYTGFGYSSLSNDVEDIAAMVTYLRKLGKEKIVLLGSSTGCQDCMKYMRATKDSIPGVDGYILQAPTSDRETAGMLMSPDFYKTTLEFAKDQIARGNKDGIMPKDLIPDVFHSPITTYRWHSLIAKGGDDDYFSSDFDDDTLAELFGCMERSTMISVSEADEMVPETVDQQTLFERWLQASPTGLVSQLSGLIPGADHTLSSAEAQQWFADRVVQFLDTVSKK